MLRPAMLTALIVPLLVATSALAADDLPAKAESVPGTCFVYTVEAETGVEKDPAAAIVNRIDLQPLQFKVDGKPLPDTRFRIGVRPKGQNGAIVNDVSAACTGEKLAFACNMKCGDKTVGRFRAEALPTKPTEPKADYLRLVIEAPTVLNGCTEGQQPYTVPPALIGVQVTLKGADRATCFR